MRVGRQLAHGLEVACSFWEIAAEQGCSKARVQQIGELALASCAPLAQRGYSVDD